MKMSKYIKNIAIFVAMILIVGIYISPSIAKASYYYGFGYSFGYDEETKYTETRYKWTYSSVGMECTTSEEDNAYYVASVYGVDDNGEAFDYSHGYRYTFFEGSNHEMYNWVRENGCRYVKVRGDGYQVNSAWGSVFTGYWSPDI